MNPYEILGVPRDAALPQIKFAYREKVKATHPDVTGDDGSEFHAVSRAYAVLSNPEARKRYDETGSIDDTSINKAQQQMLGIIGTMFNMAINHEVMQGRQMQHVDLMAAMKENLRRTRDEQEPQLQGLRRLIVEREKLKGRIKRDDDKQNIFVDMLDAQLRDLRKAEEKVSLDVKALGMALEELSHYRSIVEALQAMNIMVNGPGMYQQAQANRNLYIWGTRNSAT